MEALTRARAILVRLLTVMTLGLATTVAVAWSLAAWLPHTHLRWRKNLVGDPAHFITIFEFSRPGMVRRDWRAGYVAGTALWSDLYPMSTLKLGSKTVVHDRSWGDLPADLAHPSRTSTGAEDARGWPLLCLWCSINEPVIESGVLGSPSRDGIVLSRPSSSTSVANVRILPLRPIWRGLAADAGVYACAWVLVIPTFHIVRAAVRRRRGQCPQCGYDLARHRGAVCPECGGAARQRI